jgi:hypothetical protein
VVLVAAAAAGVAAVPALVSRPDRLPSDLAAAATADGANPQTLTVDGVPAARTGSARISGAYTDPQDPTGLFVYAGTSARPGHCNDYAAVRVAAQDAEAVTLDADRYKPVDTPPANAACSLGGVPPYQHRLDLGVPLDGRRVVDAEGNDLRVLDTGALLVPTVLPDGYRLPGQLTVGYGGTDDAGNEVAVHTFPGPDRETQIEVYQGVADKVPGRDEPVSPSVVVDRPTVRGHSAVVTRTAGLQDLTCLRWRESAQYAVTVCSRGNPAPLGSAELRAAADSMRPAREVAAAPTPQATDTPAGNRWWLHTPPQPGDRTLDLKVHERACASGRSAEGRIRPVVQYRDDSIVVTITVPSAGGDQLCPGNPDTTFTLHLAEAVGDRAILDGRTAPPSRALTSRPGDL